MLWRVKLYINTVIAISFVFVRKRHAENNGLLNRPFELESFRLVKCVHRTKREASCCTCLYYAAEEETSSAKEEKGMKSGGTNIGHVADVMQEIEIVRPVPHDWIDLRNQYPDPVVKSGIEKINAEHPLKLMHSLDNNGTD